MDNAEVAKTEIRGAGELLWAKWGWFLLLGVVLIACGVAAVILPALTTMAARVVLGIALLIAGCAYIVITLANRHARRAERPA